MQNYGPVFQCGQYMCSLPEKVTPTSPVELGFTILLFAISICLLVGAGIAWNYFIPMQKGKTK